MLYRNFDTVEELNAQYLPTLQSSNAKEIFIRWREESEIIRNNYKPTLKRYFGPTLDEYLQIYPSSFPNSPIHMFIHGGYWHSFGPDDFSFLVPKLREKNITVVLNNYSLCPKVTIDEIVRQTRSAIKWLKQHAKEFNGNENNITLSGHSAGGHLSAMAAFTDWRNEYGEPQLINGACAISGIFDLAPFPFTSLQPYLQLTWDQIRRNSPINILSPTNLSFVLVAGDKESTEFIRQRDDFAKKLISEDNGVTSITVKGANHFSILDEYLEPDSQLFRSILKLCNV